MPSSGGGVETYWRNSGVVRVAKEAWGCGEKGNWVPRLVECVQIFREGAVVITGYVSGSGTCIYPNPPRGSLGKIIRMERFQSNKIRAKPGKWTSGGALYHRRDVGGGWWRLYRLLRIIALLNCAASYQHDSIPC